MRDPFFAWFSAEGSKIQIRIFIKEVEMTQK